MNTELDTFDNICKILGVTQDNADYLRYLCLDELLDSYAEQEAVTPINIPFDLEAHTHDVMDTCLKDSVKCI